MKVKHVKLTTHRNHRLVSLAVRTVTLLGGKSGGACRVCITREGALTGPDPTMFTCRIRNLRQPESMNPYYMLLKRTQLNGGK